MKAQIKWSKTNNERAVCNKKSETVPNESARKVMLSWSKLNKDSRKKSTGKRDRPEEKEHKPATKGKIKKIFNLTKNRF